MPVHSLQACPVSREQQTMNSKLFFNRRAFLKAFACSALAGLPGCTQRPGKTAALQTPHSTPAPDPQNGIFIDVAQQAGIRFIENNGAAGSFEFVETTGGGCAFLDYNCDGFMDVLLIQTGPDPGTPLSAPRPHCVLYHNNGDGTFTDVSLEAGFCFDQGYAQGVAVGDFNNDGYPDVFITAYNGCTLLQNDGHGKFHNVTQKSGTGETGRSRWATSAAFGDYNNDGLLDLIVLHYAPWTPASNTACHDVKNRLDYCSPQVYTYDHPALYRNNGDGTFTDVTEETGLSVLKGRGLGVIWIDYDQDGKLDLFITNDLMPNQLLHNEGGRFKDVGLQAGVAYGSDGNTLSGMGVTAADTDNSGWESIVVTNFSSQPDSFYHALGKGMFEDDTYTSGIGDATLTTLSFGVTFLDYNRDGLPDVFIGNGHVDPYVSDSSPNTTYAEPKQLLQNLGGSRFQLVTADLGSLAVPTVTRGLAVADYLNHGRQAVLTNNQNEPAQLLQCRSTDSNHWVSLRLEGVHCNRDGAGALVRLTAGRVLHFAQSRLSNGYASSSDPRIYFGLGKHKYIEKLEIEWPGKHREVWIGPFEADRFYHVRQGSKPQADPRTRPARLSQNAS